MNAAQREPNPQQTQANQKCRMRTISARGLCAVWLAGLLAGCSGAGADPPHTEQWRSIEVQSRPVELVADEPGPHRLGSLVFRGGLELSSADAAFGGFSGLWIGADGRLVAISDRGQWLSARLESDPATGAPLRLIDARVGAMLDENGKDFRRRSFADAEGLAQLPDGRFAVSFEQRQVLRFYDLDKSGPAARGLRGPRLAGAGKLEANAGLEAVADAGEGRVLVAAERSEPGADALGVELWLAPVEARGRVTPAARLQTPRGYGLSGLDRLPDGDFVALERFYAPVIGVRIRVVKIAAQSLASGQARATLLAEMDAQYVLDNFESVAVLPLAHGGARLFLISDDNFAPTQRTLLYVFDLPSP